MSDSFLDDFKDDSQSALDEVMKYVDTLDTLLTTIANLSEELADTQKKYDDIAKNVLPAMLASNGLDELKLANGKKVTIREDVFVSVPKDEEKRKVSLEWLRNNGGEDLIKEDVVVQAPSEDFKEYLREAELVYEEEIAVNTNSLKAWFKRRLGMSKGSVQDIEITSVPKELNLFIDRRAEIK